MPTGLYGWGGLYGGCHGVFGFWFAGRPELRFCVLLLTVMLLCLTSVWDEENIFLVGFIPPDIHDGLLWLSVHHGGMGVIKTVWSPPKLERYTFTRGRKYHAIVSVWKLSPTMALCLRRRTPLVGVPVSSPLIQRTRPPPQDEAALLMYSQKAISFIFPRLGIQELLGPAEVRAFPTIYLKVLLP